MSQGIKNPLGAAASGWPIENHPTLSRNLQGRYGPTERLNVQTVTGSTSTTVGWQPIYVERPTILRPVAQLAGIVQYAPIAIPQTSATLTPEDQAVLGMGPGICYLWAPGMWYVHYHGSGVASFLQIPCEDPVLAAALLSEPGFMTRTEGVLVAAAANTSEQLVAANRYRRGLVITSVESGNPWAISLGGTANISSGASALGMVVTGIGGSISLGGAECYKGQVNAASTAISKTLTYVEWS